LTKTQEITREQQLELDLQAAHILQQETELKINRYIIFFLSVIFLIALLGVVFWYREYKKKNEEHKIVLQQKEELHQQKEEIQAQSDELEFQRDELYRSNKTKEKLLSVVAHDLKNPIHALIGFSDLLVNGKDNLSTEEKKQYIEYIHNSSLQIHNLLENLLKWAQSQSSSIKYQPENVNINEIIDVNLSLFAESSIKKQITLIADKKTNEHIFADKNMINTVIRNLINNAIKFTDKNGEISVSTVKSDNFIEISVTDTGVGMTDDIIRKILQTEEFHSSAGTMDEPGTGLGLAICKEFLVAHDSKLQISSQVGKGSTFSFKISTAEKA
jgi:signal transduction histidine kinase